jgi:molecular chaperone GrpE
MGRNAGEKDPEGLNEDSARSESSPNEPEWMPAGDPPGKDTAAADAPGGDSDAVSWAVAEESDPVLLRKLLAEQLSKAEENYERLVRLQADYENFRRRTRSEKEDLYKYASEKLINTLLPVLDNFELALSAAGDSIENFKSGAQMIYKQLLDVLAAEGVAPIPAVGELFDPLKHEAVLRAESEEHPDNTVIQELRRGYYLKDKVIRPAMVKVVKSI